MSAGVRTGLFIAAFFAAGGVTTAFLPIWLTDRGISAAGIGQILGLGALAKLAAVPVWGAATDYVGRRRPMLFVSAAGATALTVAFPFVHGFPGLLALVALQGVAASALTPLADTLTLALAAARRLEYARTRAWGSASYMLATAAAGPVITALGTAAVPWLLAAGFGAAACFAPLLPEPDRAPHAAGLPKTAGLWRLRPFRLTVAASALIQGSHAAYYGFATIYWRDAGLSDTVIGLLIAEGIVAEVALFVWGRRLVERIGPARLTGVAAAACLLRWTATAFTTAIAALAVIQLLHAATFAFQHLSAMLVLSRTVPPRRAASAQAIHAALGFSAPVGVLIATTGFLFSRAGGLVFLLMAALGGAALLLVRPLALALPAASIEALPQNR
jgi:PPP family 3-phenylpropionic acid transporter